VLSGRSDTGPCNGTPLRIKSLRRYQAHACTNLLPAHAARRQSAPNSTKAYHCPRNTSLGCASSRTTATRGPSQCQPGRRWQELYATPALHCQSKLSHAPLRSAVRCPARLVAAPPFHPRAARQASLLDGGRAGGARSVRRRGRRRAIGRRRARLAGLAGDAQRGARLLQLRLRGAAARSRMRQAFARTVIRAPPAPALWPSLLAPCAASLTGIIAQAAHTQVRPGSDAKPALALCDQAPLHAGPGPAGSAPARRRRSGAAARPCRPAPAGRGGWRARAPPAGAPPAAAPPARPPSLGTCTQGRVRARAGPAQHGRPAGAGGAAMPGSRQSTSLCMPRNGRRGGQLIKVLCRGALAVRAGGVYQARRPGMG